MTDCLTRPVFMGRHGVVVAGHYLAAVAGHRMLERGGNAFDAGVATAFALAVLEPAQYGIAGECPMLLYDAARGEVVAVSGQGQAPAAATVELFRGMGMDLIPGDGLLASTVPAVVNTLCAVLSHFGSFSLADVLSPAIELAADGFAMYPTLHGLLSAHADRIRREWPATAAIYLPGGDVPAIGSVLRQTDWAASMSMLVDAERLALKKGADRRAGIRAGSDVFYRGEIARRLVEFCRDNRFPDASGGVHGGLLTLDDFAAFQTCFEEPTTATYRGLEVHKCGPWSQGPVFLQQLKLLEGYDLGALGHNSVPYVHTLMEVAKIAFGDRERYYGDPLFVDVPLERMLSEEYAAQRRTEISDRRASLAYRRGDVPVFIDGPAVDSHAGDTTHVDVVDARGNMMSATPSGGWIRSSPVVPGLGFPLGTRMQMFWLDEKHPNGLRPGKRPRTTLSPSLVTRQGRPLMVFGTPGGDSQDQWTLQFFLNVVDFGMNIQEAAEAPNFYSEHFHGSFYPRRAFPGRVAMESRVPQEVRDELAAMGHDIRLEGPWSGGCVTGIRYDDGSGVIAAAASPRGEKAYAVGW